MTLQHDPSASLDFLRWWRPGGPWLLTAISPDRKSFQSRSFNEQTVGKLRTWIDEKAPGHNLYFSVNPTIRPDMVKKAEREDIKSLDWLHVDIDPRVGENIDAERTRALELLTTRLPAGVPAPSAIVFSGGGYQGFWRLEEPVPINGEEALYEDAKLFNVSLEMAFRADNCHNVDRIMRLPGSINWPDERKLKKGRVAALAAVEQLNDNIYPISTFRKATPVQTSGPLGSSSRSPNEVQVEVGGNVPRIQDLKELDKWGVPDRVKVILIQGHNPMETKKGDNSRSAWIFDAACNLVRCGVPDEVIFSIFTDPDYGISAGILDKGSNAEKYAKRQILRAKEHAIDPVLSEFNQRFAVIGSIGGKCRVIEEVQDEVLDRPVIVRQGLDDFRARFMHKYVEMPADDGKGTKRVPAGHWWLRHPNRRFYDRLVFDPRGTTDPTVYNMWQGYGVTPQPGNEHEVFLRHTREVICGGNEQHYRYTIGWLARMVQLPYLPAEVAIVLRGGMGVGKSRWTTWIAGLLGRHSMQVSNPGHLVGNFNAHLKGTIFLFADEAFFAGDKKHESVLKTLITEHTLMIEAKGYDAEQQPNYLHVVMASNKAWVIPAGAEERRFFVLDVSPLHHEDRAYFTEFMAPLARGRSGQANLLHYLLNYDISDFDPRTVPSTKGLVDQKLYSMSPEEEWWLGKLEVGALLPEHPAWEPQVIAQDLQNDYFNHMRNTGVMRRATPTALGRFLTRVLPSGYPRNFQRMAKVHLGGDDGFRTTVERRVRFYELPALDKAREHFEKAFKFKGEWLDPVELPLDDEDPPTDVPF